MKLTLIPVFSSMYLENRLVLKSSTQGAWATMMSTVMGVSTIGKVPLGVYTTLAAGAAAFDPWATRVMGSISATKTKTTRVFFIFSSIFLDNLKVTLLQNLS